MVKKYTNPKISLSRHAAEEFGGGKKGLVLCKKCANAYFKKSWHHNLDGLKNYDKDIPISFILCPACQMIGNKQYEGRVIIKNVPEKIADDLDGLIRGFCHRAYERDPLDRLIALKKGPIWEATVTENQLANKLADKIKQSFRGIKSKVAKFSGDPSDVAEIIVEFS